MKNSTDILPETTNVSDSKISLEQVPQWGERAFEWRDKSTYGQILIENYLTPLESTFGAHGDVPFAHQKRVAIDLQSYFATDWLERAPTVIVYPVMADRFHVLLGRIMRFISREAIASLEPCAVPVEIKHALLSYKGLEAFSPVFVDAYDHDQGLIRVNYYIHGTRAREEFLIDGYEIQPVFGKIPRVQFFPANIVSTAYCMVASWQKRHSQRSIEWPSGSGLFGFRWFGCREPLSRMTNLAICPWTMFSMHIPAGGAGENSCHGMSRDLRLDF